jgi:hypothetical protein
MSSNTCLSPYTSKQNYLLPFKVPCGKCSACIAKNKKSWITRCFFESKTTFGSVFATLTYAPEKMPYAKHPDIDEHFQTLDYTHMDLFIKRLRKHFSKQNRKIRYFYSGEYGTKTKRPHYHIIIFGATINDFLTFNTHNGKPKNSLDAIWSHGQTRVEEMKPNHAKYVVGYVSKKLGDFDDFLPIYVQPESVRMSTVPPLGKEGFENFLQTLIDGNKPFAKYYMTKHLSTLERYFLLKRVPNLETQLFPNTLFYHRTDEKSNSGSFSMVDFNTKTEEQINFILKRLSKNKYSFFVLDRTMSKVCFDYLHPKLYETIQSNIIDYVSENTYYLKNKPNDIKHATEYFMQGYDKPYLSYLKEQNVLTKTRIHKYLTSAEHEQNVQKYAKLDRLASQNDKH